MGREHDDRHGYYGLDYQARGWTRMVGDLVGRRLAQFPDPVDEDTPVIEAAESGDDPALKYREIATDLTRHVERLHSEAADALADAGTVAAVPIASQRQLGTGTAHSDAYEKASCEVCGSNGHAEVTYLSHEAVSDADYLVCDECGRFHFHPEKITLVADAVESED